MSKKIQLEGHIEHIRFKNGANGYIVARFRTENGTETITGNIMDAEERKSYRLEGNFIEHKKYGKQFEVSYAEEKLPTDDNAIVSVLSSKIYEGIGIKTASAIVARFGKDTFTIIEKEPQRLAEVSGITKKRAKKISGIYKQNKKNTEAIKALCAIDVSQATALLLYEEYGEKAVQKVKENPYIIVGEPFESSFSQAEKIRKTLGLAEDDENRLETGIETTLREKTYQEGDTFLTKNKLIEESAKRLDVTHEKIEDAIIRLAFRTESSRNNGIKVEMLDGREVVYPRGLYEAEQTVTRELFNLSHAKLKQLDFDIDSLIDEAEANLRKTVWNEFKESEQVNQNRMSFSDEQRKVIKNCLNSPVVAITGGPGTGKTTIIRALINILEAGGKEQKIELAAPTGHAAKRVEEATEHSAKTIHRLLGCNINEETSKRYFEKNSSNKLEADAVIVDEASMVDIELAASLLRAIKTGTRLIVVGDADQLPSVGPGNFLRDIIESEYIYAEKLEQIFRQGKESLIVVNAHRINRGEMPELRNGDPNADFYFIKRDVNQIEREVLTLYERMGAHYDIPEEQRAEDIQVLVPNKDSPRVSSKSLNRSLQALLNPVQDVFENIQFEKKEARVGDRIFREGDKVRQTKNNYSIEWVNTWDFSRGTELYNGDIGKVIEVDDAAKEILIHFDGYKEVVYPFSWLDEVEHAYAMTVHKSQGSEFPIVIMVLPHQNSPLAKRNLLYTGITRAKKAVVLIGTEEQLEKMVKDDSNKGRNSGLAIRIKRIFEQDKQNNQ